MKCGAKIFLGLILSVSGLNDVVVNPSHHELILKKISPVKKSMIIVPLTEIAATETAGACPEGMANIENLFCIDRYEASIVDKNTGEEASPHYKSSWGGAQDAGWQYEFFKKKEISPLKFLRLVKEGQPISMPVRGAERLSGFEPVAVSFPDKIPAAYATKNIAELACRNAEKRLCFRKEWYRACVGPQGPAPYLDTDGKEVFPEAYPYGSRYESGKCNQGFHTEIWPPDLLGRKNNLEMLDPRISALLGKDGRPMKRETGAFPGCANSYGVYDLVGNVHEIVADVHIAKNFPNERVVFVGSHYVRAAMQSCAEATKDHWPPYTDYSIGFRCCKDVE